MSFFNIHNHVYDSNLRILDCNIFPTDLIDKAIELGYDGIAITDHESLSSHVEVIKYAKKVRETHPDFKIALGNEIYLTDTREPNQKYYHFILVAKDAIGHRALRELSSTSWFYSYYDRGLERVPTLKSELRSIIERFRGHIIASTACLGGETASLYLDYLKNKNDESLLKIYNFIDFCLELFGDDFYLECQPATTKEQIEVNRFLSKLSSSFGIKMIVTTDTHYLTKEDRPIHKAYLTSKQGEREVDSFYEYTYLMEENEIKSLLKYSFDDDKLIDEILKNTIEIKNKIEFYDLFHKQSVSEVPVKHYESKNFLEQYPTLNSLFSSENEQEKYWVNECYNALNEKFNGTIDKGYLERLEEEARTKKVVGEKLETNMFAYPNTLQHYINMIWDSGSIVGAGRGSSCSGLNHYLLGITQLDPLEWNLPWFRYLNDERVELGSL